MDDFGSIPPTDVVGLLSLLSLPGGRRPRVRGRLHDFATLHDLTAAIAASGSPNVSQDLVAAIGDPSARQMALDRAHGTVGAAADAGIGILTFLDDGYPERLRDIPWSPDVLFVLGSGEAIRRGGVACVGTRSPSDFGRIVGERITRGLVSEGRAIVSGLAKGVDAVCHESCLAARGTTVAVLAGWPSLDAVYPKANLGLARRIVDAGGALVSERMPWEEVQSWFFPERNRLQSGLSDATLVVEAPLDSGTMHTVRHAISQGRAIAAVMPPDGRSSASGNDAIVRLSGSALLQALRFRGVPATEPRPFVVRGREDYRSLAMLGAGAPPAEVVPEEFTFFWGGVHSNWHLGTPFEVRGVRYGCGEQFMMAEKARLFGDEVRLAAILASSSPEEQKALGRAVTPFDEETWIRRREDIVFEACLERALQHPALAGRILARASTTFVEASPRDRIWGIGLAASDPRAGDRRQWRGLNLLGKAWNRVGDRLLRLDAERDLDDTTSGPRAGR